MTLSEECLGCISPRASIVMEILEINIIIKLKFEGFFPQLE
jgi:hypothetical protein